MGTVPTTYNFADVWEMAADAVPEREALVVGDRAPHLRRAGGAGQPARPRTWPPAGVGPGDHVALYLENCPEYLEAMLAAFKLRAVPVNVNYRYVAGELRYLLDNSDAVGGPHPAVARRHGRPPWPARCPAVRFVLVRRGDDYEAALAAAPPSGPAVPGRGDDDHYVIYTGGTTGLPKGVVWRHEDAFFACIGGGDPCPLRPAPSPGPRSCPTASSSRRSATCRWRR